MINKRLKASQLIKLIQLEITLHGDLDIVVVTNNNIEKKEVFYDDVDVTPFVDKGTDEEFIGIIGTIRAPWELELEHGQETKISDAKGGQVPL
jgi:hypothetical protein